MKFGKDNPTRTSIKLFGLFLCAVCLFLVCMLAIGCNNINSGNQQNSKTPVEYVEMGGNLPPIKAEYFGLGEIYYDEKGKEEAAETIKKQKIPANIDSKYSSQDSSKNLTIISMKRDGNTLEEVTERYLSNTNRSNYTYRIGNSEMYSYDNKQIEDSYIVGYTDLGTGPAIIQRCLFLDGDTTRIASISYSCFEHKISNSNIAINIPNAYNIENYKGKSPSGNDQDYTYLYYEDLTELPGVIYTTIDNSEYEKTLGHNPTLQEATDLFCKEVGSTDVKYVDLNGLQASKTHLTNYKNQDNQTYSGNVYHFIQDDKVVRLAVYEYASASTYALDAYEKAIHKTD